MKSFEYAAPGSLRDATALLSETWGKTELLAGGTDLLTSLKQNIATPSRVVSLKNIAALKGIKTGGGAVRIGATTTLAEIAADSTIKEYFPALVTAAQGVGSAQMMAMGTIGGDLCQRPRCWYYRNGLGLLAQKDGKSLVRDGQNRYHAVFGNDGQALFVSPSSFGPALIALGATLTAEGPDGKTRQIPASEFFHTPASENDRETVLKPNEILTSVEIPLKGLKNSVYEVRHRAGLDWPYVTAAVAFQSQGKSASDVRVVLGHVAPTPWVAKDAAAALNGSAVDESSAGKCAQAAIKGAKPLSQNAYKLQLIKTAVKRAVLAAASA